MRNIPDKSLYTVDPIFCDGCKSEFYHLIINEKQPTQHWCMWCFGERFGAEAMESQILYYKKKDIHEAGIPMNLLWEYPVKHFKGYKAMPLSKISLEEFNLLNKKDNQLLEKGK